MGIIIVSLLVAVIGTALLFAGTFIILAVSPAELWDDPAGVLETVGEMNADTAQLHVSLQLTTFVLLVLFAVAVLIVNIVKRGEFTYKERLEHIFSLCFYVTFLVFLGNGLVYVYHLFVKFNTVF